VPCVQRESQGPCPHRAHPRESCHSDSIVQGKDMHDSRRLELHQRPRRRNTPHIVKEEVLRHTVY
jgi:hypothetical protein